MTTLVTGGAGFIGSHLCETLVSNGRRVVCLDNLGSGRRTNVAELRSDEAFTLVDGDVRDDVATTLADSGVEPGDVDRVFHLASRASPVDFDEHALEIAATNSQGTYNVLEFATDADARAVYASTSEVYGDPEVHPQPETYNGNVNVRGGRACYDESKRLGETYATLFHREYGTDVRTVRIFNTYGPRMRADDGRVIPTFMAQAIAGTDLTVYGDGSQTRSFLYVSDLVTALRRLIERSGLANEVVNVGSTNEITINTLAEKIARLVDDPVDVRYEPLPEDDPERRQPDITRAKNLLDWEPTVDVDDGLARTLEALLRSDELGSSE